MSPAEQDRTAVESLWANYFAHDQGNVPVLPEPETDLSHFLRDVIPGEKGETWTHRSADLSNHFHLIEPEFRGKPRLAHLTACTIVCLRRNKQDARALRLFRRIVAEYAVDLSHHLNSRWLTSVCDTVVDTADNDLDRAVALIGSTFASILRLAETELRLYHANRPWPPKHRLRHGGEFHDGLTTVWTANSGDIDNIFMRVERGLQIASPVVPFVEQLINRAIDGNTFIQRITSLSGQEHVPMAAAEHLAQLRRILQTL